MTILDEIQQLSNERQRVWRQNWTVRTKREYQERLRSLDRTISRLWHEHRCEVAAFSAPRHVPREVDPVIAHDYFQPGADAPVSGHQIRVGDRWRAVDDDDLAQGVERYVADIPADLADDVAIVPLRDILARRGKTLVWRGEGHREHAIEVTLS